MFGVGQAFIDELAMTKPTIPEARFREEPSDRGHRFVCIGRIARTEADRVHAWCEQNIAYPMRHTRGLARVEFDRSIVYRDDTVHLTVRLRWENDAFAFKMRWC